MIGELVRCACDAERDGHRSAFRTNVGIFDVDDADESGWWSGWGRVGAEDGEGDEVENSEGRWLGEKVGGNRLRCDVSD